MMIAIESEGLFRTFMGVSLFYSSEFVVIRKIFFCFPFLINCCDVIGNALGRERQECGAEHYVTGKGME